MTTEMKNKVIILTGVKSTMSNINADWDSMPKSTMEGQFHASGTSLKYLLKSFWRENNVPVLGLVDYKIGKLENKKTKKLEDRTLALSFSDKLSKVTDSNGTPITESCTTVKEILTELNRFVDISSFGTVLTSPVTYGFRGAVDIAEGFNTMEESNLISSKVLSPNASGDEKLVTTNGERHYLDKAVFHYPVTVNPQVYDFEVEGVVYSKELYNELLTGLKYSPSAYKSFSKGNLETSYVMELVLKEGEYFPNGLCDNIVKTKQIFEDGFPITEIDLTRVQELINRKKDSFEKIVLHTNTLTNKVVGWEGEVSEI